MSASSRYPPLLLAAGSFVPFSVADQIVEPASRSKDYYTMMHEWLISVWLIRGASGSGVHDTLPIGYAAEP